MVSRYSNKHILATIRTFPQILVHLPSLFSITMDLQITPPKRSIGCLNSPWFQRTIETPQGMRLAMISNNKKNSKPWPQIE